MDSASKIDRNRRNAYSKKSKSKPESKLKRNSHLQKRLKSDPIFAIMSVCRGRIATVFRERKIPKKGITLELIGCEDWETVCKYIEGKFYDHPITGEPMSWDNRFNRWDIDHIKPLGLLAQDHSLKKQKALCNYRNLQPLWKEDHVKKTRENKDFLSKLTKQSST